MADLFTIGPDIRGLARDAVDTMINQLGKDCKLIFDPIQQQCPNCYFDDVNQKSSGVYNTTGPIPFTKPPCPVCRGKGVITTDPISKVKRLLIDWQPKPWQFLPTGVVVPQGLVQTKGFVTDLPDVLECKHIIIDYENAIYQNHRFVKWGEPIPTGNIVPNRYIICFWQREG